MNEFILIQIIQLKNLIQAFQRKYMVFFHASVITNESHVEENMYISQISCAYSCTKKYLPLIYFIPGVRLRYDWVGEFKTGRIHMSQNIIFFLHNFILAISRVCGSVCIPNYLFISYLYIHIKIWYTSLSSHIFNSLLIEIQRPVQQCKWPKVILR